MVEIRVKITRKAHLVEENMMARKKGCGCWLYHRERERNGRQILRRERKVPLFFFFFLFPSVSLFLPLTEFVAGSNTPTDHRSKQSNLSKTPF